MSDVDARIAALEAELGQRNAQLAIVNEIGKALVTQREFHSVIEAVGDRAVEALGATGMTICIIDDKTGDLIFNYWVDEGVRDRAREGIALGDPLSREILASGRPVVIVSAEDAAARGTPFAVGGTESYLGVPIPAGDRSIGVFAIGTSEPHAFGEADARFLSTMASSLGVALENARLVLEQHRSEEEYRRLVEELPLAIYRDRPDDTSTSLYASPKTEEIFGYPAERFMEEGFFDSVVHPDDQARVAEEVGDNLTESRDRNTQTYRVVAADGRVVWIRDDSWITRDDDGRPRWINGFMLDITDQVEAAAEIRRRRRYFEALVEISPVAIATMDPDEVVSGWNPAATRLFGYQPEEAIGRPINDLLFLPDERAAGEAAKRLADETGLAQFIGQRRGRDGEVVDVEIAIVPLVVDGEPTGYYAIYHDVTELQAARRNADAANQAKSTFLAAMSHEIRTPMNAVIGMSGLLLDTPLDPEQREYAESISTSGEALLTIINDILDFSKIEAGRLELESVPFDMAKTIRSAIELVRPLATAKGLELRLEGPGEVPLLLGDAGRLRQILLNLLSNAVKFTEHGSIAVLATAAPGSAGRWQLDVALEDTGIGIPEETMGRLFQSFSQADVSITRRYGGTGLGLAISRRLAELMGGTLTASSTGVPGEGSRFELALVAAAAPVVAAGAGSARGSEAAWLDGREDGAPDPGLRILLAEDNLLNQKLAVRLLERMGLGVDIVSNGLEAVAASEGDRYDVILMDVEMPELDGLEATRRIRAADRAPRPWIVAMTASAMEGDRELCLAAGMDDYITKPVRPELLRAALNQVHPTGGARAARS